MYNFECAACKCPILSTILLDWNITSLGIPARENHYMEGHHVAFHWVNN